MVDADYLLFKLFSELNMPSIDNKMKKKEDCYYYGWNGENACYMFD